MCNTHARARAHTYTHTHTPHTQEKLHLQRTAAACLDQQLTKTNSSLTKLNLQEKLQLQRTAAARLNMSASAASAQGTDSLYSANISLYRVFCSFIVSSQSSLYRVFCSSIVCSQSSLWCVFSKFTLLCVLSALKNNSLHSAKSFPFACFEPKVLSSFVCFESLVRSYLVSESQNFSLVCPHMAHVIRHWIFLFPPGNARHAGRTQEFRKVSSLAKCTKN